MAAINMTEPSIEEAVNIRNIGDAMQWAGWTAEQIRTPSKAVASSLETIDASAQGNLRTVAAYNGSEISDIVEAWTINGRPSRHW